MNVQCFHTRHGCCLSLNECFVSLRGFHRPPRATAFNEYCEFSQKQLFSGCWSRLSDLAKCLFLPVVSVLQILTQSKTSSHELKMLCCVTVCVLLCLFNKIIGKVCTFNKWSQACVTFILFVGSSKVWDH